MATIKARKRGLRERNRTVADYRGGLLGKVGSRKAIGRVQRRNKAQDVIDNAPSGKVSFDAIVEITRQVRRERKSLEKRLRSHGGVSGKKHKK